MATSTSPGASLRPRAPDADDAPRSRACRIQGDAGNTVIAEVIRDAYQLSGPKPARLCIVKVGGRNSRGIDSHAWHRRRTVKTLFAACGENRPTRTPDRSHKLGAGLTPLVADSTRATARELVPLSARPDNRCAAAPGCRLIAPSCPAGRRGTIAFRTTTQKNARRGKTQMNKLPIWAWSIAPRLAPMSRARRDETKSSGPAAEAGRTRPLIPVRKRHLSLAAPQRLRRRGPLEIFIRLRRRSPGEASHRWCLDPMQCVAPGHRGLISRRPSRQRDFTPPASSPGARFAHEVKGGCRRTRRRRVDLASGSRQRWIGANVRVVEGDGTTRKNKDGSPEIRTSLFPIEKQPPCTTSGNVIGSGTAPIPIGLRKPLCRSVSRPGDDDPQSATRDGARSYKSPRTWCSAWASRRTFARRRRATLDAAEFAPRASSCRMAVGDAREQRREGLIGRTEAACGAAHAYPLHGGAESGATSSAAKRSPNRPHRVRIAATWDHPQSGPW